jgi:hypothetical protein
MMAFIRNRTGIAQANEPEPPLGDAFVCPQVIRPLFVLVSNSATVPRAKWRVYTPSELSVAFPSGAPSGASKSGGHVNAPEAISHPPHK